ncbi:hypothetical protein ACF0H5_000774 [Mactra antiquata]
MNRLKECNDVNEDIAVVSAEEKRQINNEDVVEYSNNSTVCSTEVKLEQSICANYDEAFNKNELPQVSALPNDPETGDVITAQPHANQPTQQSSTIVKPDIEDAIIFQPKQNPLSQESIDELNVQDMSPEPTINEKKRKRKRNKNDGQDELYEEYSENCECCEVNECDFCEMDGLDCFGDACHCICEHLSCIVRCLGSDV